MSSSSRVRTLLLVLMMASVQICSVTSQTNSGDSAGLKALMNEWKNFPPNWKGSDPCGSGWVGISCTNGRVTSISLANMNLKGTLSGDISALSELQILDLSYNLGLTGTLPSAIGQLKKLKNLILVGCGFAGPIPESIGSLSQLVYLSLNSNQFSGRIPPSLGQLSDLYWFDIADNRIEGSIPVSDGTSPGLDMLVNTKHFHFGQNKLSGEIPEKLFSSSMTLLHVLFDGNQLIGKIPDSLGLVKSLEVVRLDRNSMSGSVPSSLNNLTSLSELYLANNNFTGGLPNLTSLISLYTLDLSNNSFDPSGIPPWISGLQSLSTLRMEDIQLQGPIPTSLFSPPNLQTVTLRLNQLNGTLDFGRNYSSQLESVDLQGNGISVYRQGAQNSIRVILADNPVCRESGQKPTYCSAIQPDSSFSTSPENCIALLQCGSGMISSPKCSCAYPYTGTIFFRSPSFSGFVNSTYFVVLQQNITSFFQRYRYPVDSVSLSNPREDQTNHQLLIGLRIFPSGQDSFNRTGVSTVGFALSNQTYKPPDIYGPYVFRGDEYTHFSDGGNGSKSSNTGIIIGAVIGGIVLLLLLTIAGIYTYHQKKRAERATEQSNPFAKWDTSKNSIDAPRLTGAKAFTFEELKKYTDSFSDTNNIGIGGYGKVYRGILPSGEIIAIKRAQQGSLQGGLEFKTEIELLSRVHHKNVVRLLGFCFDQGEQILVYEYIPNGSLRDSLSGKSGISLDWTRRLKIALGAARGLAYLHELADPPIIHRDVKSNNILLDDTLTAKVADFGLSKLVGDPEKTHVTTQVKGTMGYLDPEYYMTQQLTEKSDVYSFGVVMLELLTGRQPIERGKYVVKEVKAKMDKSRNLYDLQEILDPSIIVSTTLKGFERFVDVALTCVEESREGRPSMGEVVKEIENIMQIVGVNPNTDSASSSRTYDEASKGSSNPYGKGSFEYSGIFPSSKIEPK
ncbi:PREDICTED: probable leucine-rich repeat receptor-like protein kinase At5g49770 [Tarenaya hassleriana]|uniref:probable leucine-rich repeat receptor-like protein kinase At5g49770 n=1 Tax=Tarenaya hassleriana TaxID=28532 RepID=UPI00053C4C14|nr:PREDICTED: probable leucine-rich repeat receptor-like protein kinase At5g49770 [Tarenaya hassleriana]